MKYTDIAERLETLDKSLALNATNSGKATGEIIRLTTQLDNANNKLAKLKVQAKELKLEKSKVLEELQTRAA